MCVHPGSDLRKCWMNFLDNWHDDRPICPIDARNLFWKNSRWPTDAGFCAELDICTYKSPLSVVRLLKFSEMLEWACFLYIFGAVTYFPRSSEVIKVTFFKNFTLLLIQELVNTFVMYNRLIGTDKQCVTCKGQVVTSKGHCKVKFKIT